MINRSGVRFILIICLIFSIVVPSTVAQAAAVEQWNPADNHLFQAETLYVLTVTPDSHGSITKDPDQASYQSGTAVTLTATPSSGWKFSAWGGDAAGTTNPTTVTMDGNKTVTATFIQDAISPTPSPATIVLDPGSLSQEYNGSPRVVTATTTPAGLAYKVTYNGAETAPTAVGIYTVVATLTDAKYPALTATGSLNIKKGSQTITFNAIPDMALGTPDFSISDYVSISSGLPLSFMASGPCSITGTTVHLTGTGPCTIKAEQNGDSNYNAALDASQSFNVTDPSIRFDPASLTQVYDGTPKKVAVITAPPGLNTTVTYSQGGLVVTDPVNAGNYRVVATMTIERKTYTATGTLIIQKADQTITFDTLADQGLGSDFSINATASSGLPVTFDSTGPITITPGTNTTSTTVHPTGLGACTITARQAGNGNYNKAPDVVQSFNIVERKKNQTIAFPAISNRVLGSADFAITATASSGLPVTFTSTGPCTIISGTPTRVHLTGLGTCTITAHQAGDNQYNAAPDITRTFSVIPTPPPVIIPPGTVPPNDGRQYIAQYVDPSQPGIFVRDASFKTDDGLLKLNVPQGTRGQTTEGALSYITLLPVPETDPKLPSPDGGKIIGTMYKLGPEGTVFSQAVSLTMIYNLSLIPSGNSEKDLTIGYWDTLRNQWVILTGCQVDTVNRQVVAPLNHFSTYAIISNSPKPSPSPAAFSLNALNVAPSEVNVGQEVSISAGVTNSGGVSGTYVVNFMINDTLAESRQVTLDPGQIQTVIFKTTPTQPGTYNVIINGTNGQFSAKAPAGTIAGVPITTTPAKTSAQLPAINIKPTPEATKTAPDPEPRTSIPQGWLIAGVVAGLVIVIGLTFLLLRKKSEY